MDHEFSTRFLEPGQLGWNWLSIQMDDGVDLMLYQMRRDNGTTDPYSSGSLISEDGELQHLAAADYEMTPVETWESPATSKAPQGHEWGEAQTGGQGGEAPAEPQMHLARQEPRPPKNDLELCYLIPFGRLLG